MSPGKGSEAGAGGVAEGGEEAELEQMRSDWSSTPAWLQKNKMVEVHADGDWWQAKAVKCVHGKVCNDGDAFNFACSNLAPLLCAASMRSPLTGAVAFSRWKS